MASRNTKSTRAESKRLASASLRTGLGTIASRGTGLLRVIVATYALGGAPTGDAFNLANNTPNIIHDLVLGGVLSASFIPVFVERLATRPRREAMRSISAVVTLSLIVLVVSTLLLIVLAPEIVDLYMVGSSHTYPAERALAIDLLRYFAPQLLAYGLISLIAAVLATEGRFVAVGFVPVLNNLVAIATLAVFSVMATSKEIDSGHFPSHLVVFLGIGTTAGVVLQALALVPSLHRARIRLRLVWRPHDPAISLILALSAWTIGFVAANQVAVFVIQILEVHLNGVTEYSNAFQFFLVPYAVVAISVVNVATPGLARAFVDQESAEIGRQFGSASRQMLSLVLPAAVAYLMLANLLTTLLLGHGHYSGQQVDATASTLALFAVGLPSFCVYFLAIRTFQAMRDTRTAFYCYLVENGVNIAVAFALYHVLGLKGLALAYSVAYTVGALVAFVILRRRLGTLGGRSILTATLRSVALSALMAVVIAFAEAVVGTGGGILGWFRLIVIVGAGGIAYFGGAGIAASLQGWQTSRRT